MDTYMKSKKSMLLFRKRTATVMTALCVFMLAVGAANAVTYTDSAPQTTPGQNFVFTFSPVGPWSGGNGTFTVHARGDYTIAFPTSEYLNWDIDGLISDVGAPAYGTLINEFSYDDVEWEQSFTISGGLLNAITSDSSITISIDLSSAVDRQIDPSKHFVEVELTYNSSGPQCPPPPEPSNPDPCDEAIDIPVDTCLFWSNSSPPPPQPGQIIINEIDIDETDTIELFNPTGTPVDLTGWQVIAISNNGVYNVTYTIPSFTLNAGAYVVIHEISGTDTNTNLFIGINIDWIGFDPGSCTLVDAGSVGIDFVRWSDDTGVDSSTDLPPAGTNWTGNDPMAPLNEDLHSLGRDAVSTDTDNGIDWENTSGVNADAKTPGSANTGGLRITNEFSENPGFDIDGTSEPESPMLSSTTVPSGFLISNGILVEEQSQEELSSVVVEETVSFTSIAGATLISFDDGLAPCLFHDTIRLTGKYAGLGVIFEGPGGNDGGAILNECGNFGVSGHSSPNFLAFNAGSALSDGGIPRAPETMHFSPAVSQVQFLAGSGFSAGQMLTVEGYNDINLLVDSATITLSPAMSPISVSGIGITTVVVSTSADVFVLDDLQFTPGDPCPTTWDVYLGTDSTALELIASNLNEPNHCPGILESGTTYFWQVIAKNLSAETPGNLWSFETEGGAPPDCSTAVPSIAEIWPPRHGWVDIEILDVNDPDGDPVTITITGITQDEPVVGYGSGNTCPDGMGVGTSVASIRSERSGQGNGRIYEISFEADDGTGNSCTGTVNVCVPHDQGQGRECINDGPLYDSTATELFKADLNNDGIINALDLSILTNYWLVSYELED
jgi:hypothetical protein